MKKAFFLVLLALTALTSSAFAQTPTCPSGTQLVYENGSYVCKADQNTLETNYGQIVQGVHPYELNSKAGK